MSEPQDPHVPATLDYARLDPPARPGERAGKPIGCLRAAMVAGLVIDGLAVPVFLADLFNPQWYPLVGLMVVLSIPFLALSVICMVIVAIRPGDPALSRLAGWSVLAHLTWGVCLGLCAARYSHH